LNRNRTLFLVWLRAVFWLIPIRSQDGAFSALDDLVLGQNLTAAQAHLIVGECWTGSRCRALKKAFRETLTGQPCGETLGRSASPMPRPGQERTARAAHFSPVILGPLNG
jgi:hypothetical protein